MQQSPEKIIDYLQHLSTWLGDNPELARSYLSLTDDDGKSILGLIENMAKREHYKSISPEYEKLKRKFFPSSLSKDLTTDINTHTASVHRSVDQSFVKLAHRYCELRGVSKNVVSSIIEKGMVNDRVIKVTRTDDWTRHIAQDLQTLEKALQEILSTDEKLEAFLKPTLTKKEQEAEKLDHLKKKYRFQAQAALRFVQAVRDENQRKFGNRYEIKTDNPLSCGLIFREIVAIGYSSIFDDENMLNRPGATTDNNGYNASINRNLIYFIENLYRAKRGYNIDTHGEDEWLRPAAATEADDNKCPGGTINQIAAGLANHRLVNVTLVNKDTMRHGLLTCLQKILPKINDPQLQR